MVGSSTHVDTWFGYWSLIEPMLSYGQWALGKVKFEIWPKYDFFSRKYNSKCRLQNLRHLVQGSSSLDVIFQDHLGDIFIKQFLQGKSNSIKVLYYKFILPMISLHIFAHALTAKLFRIWMRTKGNIRLIWVTMDKSLLKKVSAPFHGMSSTVWRPFVPTAMY